MNRLASALAALALFTCSAASNAQKPALTQNIDERGRVPYQVAANCIISKSNVCKVFFPIVPAGSRLVLTQLYAHFTVGTTGGGFTPANYVTLGGMSSVPVSLPSDAFDPIQFNTTAQNGDSSSYVVNQPISCYFNAGDTPTVTFTAAFAPAGQVVLVGYLIANP